MNFRNVYIALPFYFFFFFSDIPRYPIPLYRILFVFSSWFWKDLRYSRDSVTRFFASGFFHESVSPQAKSTYQIRTVSNFFENSRRYSQVKVHHRYQRYQAAETLK
jgi:hypothetical protein